MNYWLMKSEPDVFSIDQLKKVKKSLWDGVRNYQARNFMLREMQVGDFALFYHSNAKPPGVAGVCKITKIAQPDPTQFDKKSEYYDPKSTKEVPIWHCVEVGYHSHFKKFVCLDEIKNERTLKDMVLLKRSRLSIQPVTKKEFEHILSMGE